jgi:hypothetical protein
MGPLFSAVICGCNAGLFQEALHEVYIPRIQRGDAYFAAKVLGTTGPLLSALVHFFEHGRWGSLGVAGGNGHRRAKPHRGRSAFNPHAGGVIPSGHARIGITGGRNLLRAGRALVSVPRLSTPAFHGTHRSVALCPPH